MVGKFVCICCFHGAELWCGGLIDPGSMLWCGILVLMSGDGGMAVRVRDWEG